jgi:hypothetical protein
LADITIHELTIQRFINALLTSLYADHAYEGKPKNVSTQLSQAWACFAWHDENEELLP